METGDGGGEKPGDSGGDKREIRRPMNAFLIFCKRHRSMVREKHPDRDNRSVTRILGDLWANLAKEEKSVYTKLAKTYKDAFMKANPDYKWHSTDRLPQPAKMATRPTNVRPPRRLSTSDAPPMGHSDGDKMGGLNLLLLAGKQSMPGVGDQATSSSPQTFDSKLTSAELMGANSALLQLAEMCSSSEPAVRQMDPAVVCSAPPKKRARHWSQGDSFHNFVDKSKLSPGPLLFHPISHPGKSLPAPTATQTSQSDMLAQKPDHFYQPIRQSGIILPRKETEQYNTFRPVTAVLPKSVSPPVKEEKEEASFGVQTKAPPTLDCSTAWPETVSSTPWMEGFNMDVGMPPKKKFTKLHDRYKEDRRTAAATATTTESGCLSDQNDNAIFTCGKLVVDHIIDRLFSANLTTNEHNETVGPSSTDIEKVRKIITADITEREKSQGPSNREVGKILSEVVQKPQNLVEKVIEEAYNMDLKRRTKHDFAVSSEPSPRPITEDTEQKPALLLRPPLVGKGDRFIKMEAIPEHAGRAQPDTEPLEVKPDIATLASTSSLSSFHASNNVEATQPPSKFIPLVLGKDEREERYAEEITSDNSKEEGGEYLQDEEEGYSQPVRKSRRRNRGQRYQELINEGIIQPSKERLAARRHEQIPAMVSATLTTSLMMGEEMGEEEAGMMDKPRQGLKRSNSEVDSTGLDEKRYRTGDFDLEAEIATLPPCSLDQVPRRRGPRKRSDSENGSRGDPPFGQMKEESSSPEPHQGSMSTLASSSSSTSSSSQPVVPAEPLTGSQKRKARKHSINRLVASSTESGSKAKPPGIQAAIPMVRDATVSPVKNTHSRSPPSSSESSTSATSTTTTKCSSASVIRSVLPAVEKTASVVVLQKENMQHKTGLVTKMLKPETSVTTAECVLEERKTCSSEQKLVDSVNVVQTAATLPEDVKPDVMTNPSTVTATAEEGAGKLPVDSFKEESSLTETANNSASTTVESEGGDFKDKMPTSVNEVKGCVETITGAAAVLKEDRDTSVPFTGVVVNTVECVDSAAVIGEANAVTEGGEESAQLFPTLSPEDSTCFETSAEENKHKPRPKRQLREMLSSDSGRYSSLEECEDRYRESTLDSIEEDDKPCVFLSETSGLLCVTQPIAQKSLDMEMADSTDSSSHDLKTPSVLALEDDDQKADIASAGLTLLDSQDEAGVEDSASQSTVAIDTEDSLDDGNCVLTVSESISQAEVDFSTFPSSAATTTGPRVTTVTMTTTDAIPTALSLEMMEEDGMVESGMGNPMLCGSPMPESPSMTAVHS